MYQALLQFVCRRHALWPFLRDSALTSRMLFPLILSATTLNSLLEGKSSLRADALDLEEHYMTNMHMVYSMIH